LVAIRVKYFGAPTKFNLDSVLDVGKVSGDILSGAAQTTIKDIFFLHWDSIDGV
jgi:hypothetical protein